MKGAPGDVPPEEPPSLGDRSSVSRYGAGESPWLPLRSFCSCSLCFSLLIWAMPGHCMPPTFCAGEGPYPTAGPPCTALPCLVGFYNFRPSQQPNDTFFMRLAHCQDSACTPECLTSITQFLSGDLIVATTGMQETGPTLLDLAALGCSPLWLCPAVL